MAANSASALANVLFETVEPSFESNLTVMRDATCGERRGHQAEQQHSGQQERDDSFLHAFVLSIFVKSYIKPQIGGGSLSRMICRWRSANDKMPRGIFIDDWLFH